MLNNKLDQAKVVGILALLAIFFLGIANFYHRLSFQENVIHSHTEQETRLFSMLIQNGVPTTKDAQSQLHILNKIEATVNALRTCENEKSK